MMFLSAREVILLTELSSSSTAVSVNEMMSLLKVSRRTIYRELENLKVSLESIGAELRTVSRGKFELLADETAMKQIRAAIYKEEAQVLSATERQRAILLELLTANEPIAMVYFLEEYVISNTTFYGDIKQLELKIGRLPLAITRNRGYELTGPEKYRRLLLANVLLTGVNEYHFFYFAELEEHESYFLQFVQREHLLFAQKIVQEDVAEKLTELSDRKLEFLILMLTIVMDRIPQGFALEDDAYQTPVNKELLNIAKQLFSKISVQTNYLYPISEIVFFANLLSGFSNSFDQDFFEDTFDTNLAYSVKHLIELVSNEAEVNFFEDDKLYKMLLTHLSGVFSRSVLQEETLNNPILERMMEQYPDIAAAIRRALPEVFQEKALSEEEIAYMVVHFASSLERSPRVMEIDIAGISPSGLASTSMLEMRLRRYFPFINEINFFRIADLGKFDLEQEYDLIISTSLLPGYRGKYLLVSPLLLEDEIKQLKEEFKAISHKKSSVYYGTKRQAANQESYEEMLAFIDAINGVLERFAVYSLTNSQELSETIYEALALVSSEIIQNQTAIHDKLFARYQQTPIGIPNTSMALFHASSDAVRVPCFFLVDLQTPLPIRGMDKEMMTLSRMLVMLAPAPIDDVVGKLLGKISGAIIMNDLNTEIFNSGNEAIIYQLLSSLLIEEIQH